MTLCCTIIVFVADVWTPIMQVQDSANYFSQAQDKLKEIKASKRTGPTQIKAVFEELAKYIRSAEEVLVLPPAISAHHIYTSEQKVSSQTSHFIFYYHTFSPTLPPTEPAQTRHSRRCRHSFSHQRSHACPDDLKHCSFVSRTALLLSQALSPLFFIIVARINLVRPCQQ